mmetsp:Transcript_9281/g.32134  ORF Transcript_9281/g.32134 Transcript_9281/m.32134 type:complete len:236 (+) Transcript_9281:57-764(+)
MRAAHNAVLVLQEPEADPEVRVRDLHAPGLAHQPAQPADGAHVGPLPQEVVRQGLLHELHEPVARHGVLPRGTLNGLLCRRPRAPCGGARADLLGPEPLHPLLPGHGAGEAAVPVQVDTAPLESKDHVVGSRGGPPGVLDQKDDVLKRALKERAEAQPRLLVHPAAHTLHPAPPGKPPDARHADLGGPAGRLEHSAALHSGHSRPELLALRPALRTRLRHHRALLPVAPRHAKKW